MLEIILNTIAYLLLLLSSLYGVLGFGLWLTSKIIRQLGLWGDLVGFMRHKYQQRKNQ